MKRARLALILLAAAALLSATGQSLTAAGRDEATTQDEASSDETKTKEVKVKDITLQVPVDWKTAPNESSMRLATFEIPPAGSDDVAGEMTVFFFPGGGGDVGANLDRWTDQFAPEGREVKITRGKAGDRTYIVSTVSGTYRKPIGPIFRRQTENVEGYRMISVILNQAEGQVYYLKLVGPDETIQSAAGAFRRTFGGDVETETEFEL